MVTSLRVTYFSAAASDESQLEKLCAQNSRSVFCADATRAASNSPSLMHLINVQCASNYSCFEDI